MVRGRPTHAKGTREGVEVSLGLSFPFDRRRAETLGQLAQRSIGLEEIDSLELPIGSAHRAGEIRLLGVQEPVETVAHFAPYACGLEIEQGAIGAGELQQGGHLFSALEIHDPSAPSPCQTPARTAFAEVAAQGLGPTPAPEDKLDVRTRGAQGERSTSKQDAAQVGSAIAGRSRLPRPIP